MKKMDIMFRGGGGRKSQPQKDKKNPVITPEVIIKGENELPVVKKEEVAPVVVMDKNKVVVILVQDTTKPATRTVIVNGEKVKQTYEKPVKHYMEFFDETTELVTSKQISNFVVGSLAKYQVLQKMQGKAAFDTTLPIEMSVKAINQSGEKTIVSGLKFSTNAKAIDNILSRCTTGIASLFNPQSSSLRTTDADIKATLTGLVRTVLPAAKPLEVNEEGNLQVAEKGLDMLENAE